MYNNVAAGDCFTIFKVGLPSESERVEDHSNVFGFERLLPRYNHIQSQLLICYTVVSVAS